MSSYPFEEDRFGSWVVSGCQMMRSCILLSPVVGGLLERGSDDDIILD